MYTQLIALLFLAGTNPVTMDAPKPPQISAEMRARFWRAQAEAIAAAARAKQAQEAVRTAEEEMQKTCGERFVAAFDATGEPSCQAKQ